MSVIIIIKQRPSELQLSLMHKQLLNSIHQCFRCSAQSDLKTYLISWSMLFELNKIERATWKHSILLHSLGTNKKHHKRLKKKGTKTMSFMKTCKTYINLLLAIHPEKVTQTKDKNGLRKTYLVRCSGIINMELENNICFPLHLSLRYIC